MKKCLRCGKSNIDQGRLSSTGTYGGYEAVMYRSDKETLTHNMRTTVFAITCLDCGHIEIYNNPEHLKEIMGRTAVERVLNK